MIPLNENLEFEIVLNGSYGGFSLTKAIYDRLKQRGSKWAPLIYESWRTNGGYYALPYLSDTRKDEVQDIAFRTDPDFVAIIKDLTTEVKQVEETMSHRQFEAFKHKTLGDLVVVRRRLSIEIDSYDGLEKVDARLEELWE